MTVIALKRSLIWMRLNGNGEKRVRVMQLMTKELENKFKKVGRQEHIEDPIVVAKFFDPTGPGTWLATEYDPGARLFFGWATLGLGPSCDEWGYFSLQELESVRGAWGLGIERDLYWQPKTMSEARREIEQCRGD